MVIRTAIKAESKDVPWHMTDEARAARTIGSIRALFGSKEQKAL